MKKAKIILNPSSGPWAEQEKIDSVEHAMQAAGIEYHLESTYSGEQATQLTKQAIQAGWPVVVAAGGDGRINGDANGCMQGAREKESDPGLDHPAVSSAGFLRGAGSRQ